MKEYSLIYRNINMIHLIPCLAKPFTWSDLKTNVKCTSVLNHKQFFTFLQLLVICQPVRFLLFSPIFYIAPTKMSEPRPPVTKTDKQKVSLLRYRTCVSRGTYVILKKQKNRGSACFDYKLLENNIYRWCSCQNRKWHHEPSLDILGHTWLCILRSSIRCSRSSRNFCTSSCNFSCFSSNFIVSCKTSFYNKYRNII